MITATNIHLTRGDTGILRAVNCRIEGGAITALIGPNGSGKSSFLGVLSGLIAPTVGSCGMTVPPTPTASSPHYRGYDSMSRAEFARHIALLPQRNPVPASLTVADLVAFGRHPHRPWYRRLTPEDKALIDWAMAETGVVQYQSRPLTHLSGGELQRCWLAMVLAQDTPIMMLDEPTSWLDIGHQISLLEIVRRLNHTHGKTVVWVLHDLNQAKHFSDNAILLQAGEVVASGSCEEVIRAEIIAPVYRTPMTTHPIDGTRVLWPRYSCLPEPPAESTAATAAQSANGNGNGNVPAPAALPSEHGENKHGC